MRPVSFSRLLFASLLCVALSACSTSLNTLMRSTTSPQSTQGVTITGRVHGGQQPISGAHVYLYAANVTGYNQASVSLLKSAAGTTEDGNGHYYVTTASDGTFSITSDYSSCPAATTQVYLYSSGGSSGSGANTAIGLLAALGTCTSLSPANTYVVVNEVSTIATAYAIAGFATDPLEVSSSGTALAVQGVTNAFAAVQNLETLGTGVALSATIAGNGTVPQSEINTLANFLAACINSTGSTSSACTTLLGAALSGGDGGSAPPDTAYAAVNIAHFPWAHLSTLWGLQSSTPPFEPALNGAPNDFSLAIAFTSANMDEPNSALIDGSGNVWVPNRGNSSLTEFGPTGTVLSGTTGFTGGGMSGPGWGAIDSTGNVWVPNWNGTGVSEIGSNGTPVSSSAYTGGGLTTLGQIAIDSDDDVWITNTSGGSGGSGSITELSSSGTAISSSSGFTGGGLDVPVGIAIDNADHVWVADFYGDDISEFASSGTAITNSNGYSGGGMDEPEGIAIDPTGDAWTTSPQAATVSEFNDIGVALSPSGVGWYAGLTEPYMIAVDGGGYVWVSDVEGGYMVEFTGSGIAIYSNTGTGGFGQMSSPDNLAIDGSGNLWVANFGAGNVVEFIGIATPTVTPMCANLRSPYGKYSVNEP